ncbi:MAG: efflux RND transporter periplasmic adaptor subunit [Verrucomicrobiota bacterium]
MKPKIVLFVLLVAMLGGVAGWFAARQFGGKAKSSESSGRKILYYQSAMHPWIKSDKPGRCTICGMELVPVYEGETGFEASADLVSLDSNIVNVIHVQTERVQRRSLVRTVRVAGTIDDNEARHRILSAYVDGRIEKLFVNFMGAEVVEGEPLATIYSPMLLTAEREYVSLAKQPRAAVPEIRAEQDRLLEAAAQRLRQYGLTERQIAALPDKSATEIYTEILAPMTGTVVARDVYAGQYVKEGDKLFELADFSTMWFVFDVYERDLPWIKVGDVVRVHTPALPGQSLEGPVTFVDPNLREMTRSAKVRVELPNPVIEENGHKRRALLHKLYADAEVQVQIPEVLAISRSAVLQPGPQPLVYVDKGSGTYEQRKVKLGRRGDVAWEILEGVEEGESAVTQGNMLIDSQAQLNQSASGAHAHQEAEENKHDASPAHPVPLEKLPDLSEAEANAAREFLAVVDAVTQALASDDLRQFNQVSPQLHSAIPALKQAFEKNAAWQPLIQKIDASGHLSSAGDLAQARKAFLPFSMATVDFAKAVRKRASDMEGVKIFQCPMVNQAVPGAARNGFWVQAKGPLRNPFFGAEMLDCGTEVKP